MYDLFLIPSKNIVRNVCSNDAITSLRFADSGDAANMEHPTQVPSQDPLPPTSEGALPEPFLFIFRTPLHFCSLRLFRLCFLQRG